jgi:chlorite dismutase
MTTHVPSPVMFVAGEAGPWRIEKSDAVLGDAMEIAPRLFIADGRNYPSQRGVWSLMGTSSNGRYVRRSEAEELAAIQEGLGRPQATCAALIPIRKSAEWWAMAQDERRAIMEEQSHHIGIGMEYLPAISRKLYHSRDFGEPFDFITWFEYRPEHIRHFEQLLQRLRATVEWRYVEREVDIRLTRAD